MDNCLQPELRKEGEGTEPHVKTALCSKTLQQAEVMGLDFLLTPLILGCNVPSGVLTDLDWCI